MNILIVGAGIGGLAAALSLSRAGHKVKILESAHVLAEIGAGVQFTPNTTKWLWKWGLAEDILSTSALPGSFRVLDGGNGDELGSVDFADFEQQFGGPYLVIHRADIHKILCEHAVKAGADIRLNSRVKEYLPDQGRVILTDGSCIEADLIVAADGIHSLARKFLVGNDTTQGDVGNNLETTGWSGYRLMADISALRDNAATKHLTTSHDCNCATGTRCSIMTYAVKNSEKMNLVLSHPDDVDTTGWTQEQFRAAVEVLFQEFGPQAQALLNVALSNQDHQITNWPVHQVVDLPRWRSDSGKLVLIGDAAHSMAYFLSIGVSMAVEDAAAVTECLEFMQKSNGKVSLDQAMSIFEAVRKPRAEVVREASVNAGRVLMLPPGQERDERDATLKIGGGPSTYQQSMTLDEMGKIAMSCRFGILDSTLRDWLYGYDVVDDIRQVWRQQLEV